MTLEKELSAYLAADADATPPPCIGTVYEALPAGLPRGSRVAGVADILIYRDTGWSTGIGGRTLPVGGEGIRGPWVLVRIGWDTPQIDVYEDTK